MKLTLSKAVRAALRWCNCICFMWFLTVGILDPSNWLLYKFNAALKCTMTVYILRVRASAVFSKSPSVIFSSALVERYQLVCHQLSLCYNTLLEYDLAYEVSFVAIQPHCVDLVQSALLFSVEHKRVILATVI
jgi:hypothetical protein